MSTQYTTYFELSKPEEGDTSWDGDVNTNWDVIDQNLGFHAARHELGGDDAITLGDYLQYSDVQTSSTGGTGYNSGAWRTVPLNTEVHDTGGHGSLSSNQITLAAGTYEVDATVNTGYRSGWQRGQLILYNVSDSAVEVIGRTLAVADHSMLLSLCGRFTIAATKTFELRVQVGGNTSGQSGADFGVDNVYNTIVLRKVA